MEHKVKKLTVKYNGKIVGYLAELENGKLAFQYDEKWVKNGFSISPFSLPLDTSIRYGDKDLFGGLCCSNGDRNDTAKYKGLCRVGG